VVSLPMLNPFAARLAASGAVVSIRSPTSRGLLFLPEMDLADPLLVRARCFFAVNTPAVAPVMELAVVAETHLPRNATNPPRLGAGTNWSAN
jgi:hypothetical protein